MPNHGGLKKDLNGGSLSIKGTKVLDSDRNLKVKTLKAPSSAPVTHLIRLHRMQKV